MKALFEYACVRKQWEAYVQTPKEKKNLFYPY